MEKNKKHLTIITLRQFAALFGVKRELIGELCVSEWHDKIGDAKRYKVGFLSHIHTYFYPFLNSTSLIPILCSQAPGKSRNHEAVRGYTLVFNNGGGTVKLHHQHPSTFATLFGNEDR